MHIPSLVKITSHSLKLSFGNKNRDGSMTDGRMEGRKYDRWTDGGTDGQTHIFPI